MGPYLVKIFKKKKISKFFFSIFFLLKKNFIFHNGPPPNSHYILEKIILNLTTAKEQAISKAPLHAYNSYQGTHDFGCIREVIEIEGCFLKRFLFGGPINTVHLESFSN